MLWKNAWSILHYGSGLTIGTFSVKYLIKVGSSTAKPEPQPQDRAKGPFRK